MACWALVLVLGISAALFAAARQTLLTAAARCVGDLLRVSSPSHACYRVRKNQHG